MEIVFHHIKYFFGYIINFKSKALKKCQVAIRRDHATIIKRHPANEAAAANSAIFMLIVATVVAEKEEEEVVEEEEEEEEEDIRHTATTTIALKIEVMDNLHLKKTTEKKKETMNSKMQR